MDAFTKAIAVFEVIATANRIDYNISRSFNRFSSKPIDIISIERRDAVQEQCLWAIEQLHAAYERERERERDGAEFSDRLLTGSRL